MRLRGKPYDLNVSVSTSNPGLSFTQNFQPPNIPRTALYGIRVKNAAGFLFYLGDERPRFITGLLFFKFLQRQRPSYVTNTFRSVAFLIGLNRRAFVVFLFIAKNTR